MSIRWLWSQLWTCSTERSSAKKVGDEITETLENRNWTSTRRFRVHLSLEEALIKRLKEQAVAEAQSQFEVICRESASELQLVIDGEVVFSDQVE